MEHLSNDHEDCPNHHEHSHRLCDKTGHPYVNLMEKLMETDTTTCLEFLIGGKAISEQILLASKERKI